METVGIIAEYNPFHNGHLYHLEKIKELYPSATIVLVMAGNYTERGDVAIVDKWQRTKMALSAGIDLVVELPFPFATQSADFFAYGATTILEKLKVGHLVFGSESNDIETIKKIAKEQINNPMFEKLVKYYSKLGNNYPTALSLSLKDLIGEELKAPNDLLGISYLKSIIKNNYNIEAHCIKRTNNYLNKELEELSSSTAIREALKNNQDIKNQVPEYTIKYLDNLHFIDDYFPLLKYKILTEDLTNYNMVEEGIDQKLKKEITDSSSIDELINKVKSKRYTYNKISRILLHILCNFTKDKNKEFNKITYIRILGFNNKGKTYLNSIKKDLDIPIISKINRYKDKMLEYELLTSKIYYLVNKDNNYNREYQKIIIGDDLNDKK